MSQKIVEIRRKPNYTRLPDDVYSDAKRKIGCCLTRAGDIETGLSLKEQKELLPDIIGISYEEAGFRKAVREFFANLTITTPAQLNITTDEKGFPEHPMDYVKYRWAIKNPLVAKDEETYRKSSTKYMYIVFDRDAEKKKSFSAQQLRKSAYKEFIKISTNTEKIDNILKVRGKYHKDLDDNDKEMLMNQLVDTDPEMFISLALDKDLDLKAFIEDCISKEVLRKVGTSIINGDESLGSTIEEAILYLKDKKNSEVLTTLKARLQMFKL